MTDPREIYLQPECCADEATGRLWCEDDSPEPCEDGKSWTRYVLADRAANMPSNVRRALAIAQAVDESHPQEVWRIVLRADELLKEKP